MPRPRRSARAGSGATATAASRTLGRYASATVRGTVWLTQDTCTATTVRVRSGHVDVLDIKLRKHFLLGPGEAHRPPLIQRPSDSYSGFGLHPSPEARRFEKLKIAVTSAMSMTSSSLQPDSRSAWTSASAMRPGDLVSLTA